MRRKCRFCLCSSCLKVCCDRLKCGKKKESCGNYLSFRQLSIFEQELTSRPQSTPRKTWEDYEIDRGRREKLRMMCRDKAYGNLVRQLAYRANADIAEYIIKSVTESKSYDRLEFNPELGRIPYGKTDFYGIRRYFYYLFDLEVRKEECMKN